MKRAARILWLLLALASALPTHEARAAETADAHAALLRRYDALNDEIQSALNEIEGGAPPAPTRVLSMRRNASVTFGGEVRATYAYADGSGGDASFEPAAGAETFDSKTADLFLSALRFSADVRAGERWRAFIDLNLHGHPGPYDVRPDDKDIINQAYLELMKVGHSGFGAIFGKVKLPFGLWKRPNLFAKSFMDSPNLSASRLNSGVRDNALLLPHASRFLDPAVAALLYYEMRDIIRFDAAVFQEREPEEFSRGGGTGGGTTEVRGKELPPLSWQAGASIQPLENWELTAHFRNRHSRAPDAGSSGATRNEQALIIGAAVEIPTTNLSVSAEYAHGWNQGFNKNISSDGVNIGLAYTMSPKLTLHAQGEWLRVRDGSRTRDRRTNDLYRALLGAEYELARNLLLEAGWQYEYWRAESAALGESRLAKANLLYFGTRFVF